jgi:hypothetical protein
MAGFHLSINGRFWVSTEASRRHAPWYVVPADDKLNSRLIVSQVLIDTLAVLKLLYPRLSAARRRELLAIRKHLTP